MSEPENRTEQDAASIARARDDCGNAGRKTRKLEQQRERRQRYPRIDYYPSDAARAVIMANTGNRLGGDFSSVINRLILHITAEHRNKLTPSARANNLGSTRANDLAALLRVPCGARRRRDGHPCEALSVPGKRRCKWHGGCSTGPRTAEGKARVAANLRKPG
ncbi:HGGxSTG domain-containing protein [Rhodanobacter sp. Root561]|uniref:HGGxSTG domain-containing protein n=1 Tax=Rhodanobacter sp. Root561 TaxID=1736560 RepID=UPI0009EA78A5|nr:HGGxSTG domain-containing protein [Rhodanobacter sp. Root561]